MDANSAAVLAAHVFAATTSQQPSNSLAQPLAAVSAVTSKDALTSLVVRDPALFLERYGKYLTAEDFALFGPVAGDYETAHWIAHYTKSHPPTPTQRRNRRLKYLSTPAGIAAFEISALEARAPHALLSAHRRQTASTHSEQQPLAAFPESMSLVDRIYHDYDRQAAQDAAAEEEFETDSESESDHDDDDDDDDQRRNVVVVAGDDNNGQETTTRGEVVMLSPDASFRDAMVRRFLDGEDQGVDYAVIDADADLEVLSDVGLRDAEEVYFNDSGDDDGNGGGGQPRRRDYARFHESREVDVGGVDDEADLDY
ncbi:hypothetical protein BDZ88DRAFT_511087 [Geranomyces variabilis]|nr:hypothetical protein BDZ88DRAFT_511087 [Geranomyces variabilis]KAJ3133932.1 hypothetical protein HDU90_005541 [Geranomyces variabilis]